MEFASADTRCGGGVVVGIKTGYTLTMLRKALACLLSLCLTTACQKHEHKPKEAIPGPAPISPGSSGESPERGDDSQSGVREPEPDADRALISHLWENPLGKLFDSYMADSGVSASSLADLISQRVFSDPTLVLPRLEALRLLSTDLAGRNLGDWGVIGAKIDLLQLTFSRDQLAMGPHERMLPDFKQILPYLLGYSFFAGSKQFRRALVTMGKRVYRRFAQSESHGVTDADGIQFVGSEFFHEYSLNHAYRAFMHSSMAYMVLEEVAGAHGSSMAPQMKGYDRESLLEIEGL